MKSGWTINITPVKLTIVRIKLTLSIAFYLSKMVNLVCKGFNKEDKDGTRVENCGHCADRYFCHTKKYQSFGDGNNRNSTQYKSKNYS